MSWVVITSPHEYLVRASPTFPRMACWGTHSKMGSHKPPQVDVGIRPTPKLCSSIPRWPWPIGPGWNGGTRTRATLERGRRPPLEAIQDTSLAPSSPLLSSPSKKSLAKFCPRHAHTSAQIVPCTVNGSPVPSSQLGWHSHPCLGATAASVHSRATRAIPFSRPCVLVVAFGNAKLERRETSSESWLGGVSSLPQRCNFLSIILGFQNSLKWSSCSTSRCSTSRRALPIHCTSGSQIMTPHTFLHPWPALRENRCFWRDE
jgi:hypothetical protein